MLKSRTWPLTEDLFPWQGYNLLIMASAFSWKSASSPSPISIKDYKIPVPLPVMDWVKEKTVAQSLPTTWGKEFWELLGNVSSLLQRHEDIVLPLSMGVAFLSVTWPCKLSMLRQSSWNHDVNQVEHKTNSWQGQSRESQRSKVRAQTFCSWTFYHIKEFFSWLGKPF